MSKKKDENLPALPSKSFELATTAALPDLSVSTDLAKEFDAEDFEGYSETRESLPIVTIRQKDVKNEDGDVLIKAGNFRMRDSVFDKTTDIKGMEGLYVSPLADTPCRVFFNELTDDQPTCKSRDAKTGTGEPGGVCEQCILNRFHPQNDGKKICNEGRMILVHDKNLNGCYLLQLSPSGIKPYDKYKKLVRRLYPDTPFFMIQVHVTAVYETKPMPHYRPEFMPVGVGDHDIYAKLKQFRLESKDMLNTTADKAIDANPEHETLDADAEVVDSELPGGAEKAHYRKDGVNTDVKGQSLPVETDEDLPFQ